MADVDTSTETSPETLAEATSLGWVPQEKFKGDPARWVSAETFVERGHQVMPILKANNARLLEDVALTKTELAALKVTNTELTQSMKDLIKFQKDEVKRQVEARISELKADKKAALKDGDHDLAAELDEQLDTAREELAKPPAIKEPTPAPAPVSNPDWAVAFGNENGDWLGKDKRKTGLFAGLCDEIMATTPLRGRPLLDKAKEEMETILAGPKTPPANKSEGHSGGGGSGGGGGSSGGAKSFASLPADAQAVCKAEARKFVGPNKAFKTEAEWQKHYTVVYFEE